MQITDVAPPVSVPADKRLDGMLDACDLVLAFTKTSSHQEAVHILAGEILVVEINVHIRPVAEESVFTGSRHQNRTPGKLQSHILERRVCVRDRIREVHPWANLVEFLVHVGKLAANRGNRH